MVVKYDIGKSLWFAVLGAVFVAIGLWMALDPSNAGQMWRGLPVQPMGWVTVGFFSLTLVAVAIRLMWRDALVLDVAGFSLLRPPWRKRQVAWTTLRRVETERTRGGYILVHCTLATAPTPLAALQQARSIEILTLPTGLTEPPEKLVALLEDWRRRYSGANP